MEPRLAAPFTWPVRVYYEDTDLGGVVYYANYLKFLERARSEWLRHLGVSQSRLLAGEGVLFAITGVEIRYLQPARFEDELVVTVALERMRRASMSFQQTILRQGSAPELLCTARVTAACLRAADMRPTAFPPHLFPE
ncbi:tol-pal system-associated acyl-CoA thioesterase [Thioalkalivibrio sp. XN8]|uniref:tol-pal system-associated acyl-CoA thioesterase n=1 Tax=Thioalkalivibrio sp. XN8 TaxID=2712863 RepID=UPI0013E9FD5B|nr:tol-pal system-associated acyl-CoA thioesterase [Thioalkalivibrio sp. XN8]